jgi:hypothetical protein
VITTGSGTFSVYQQPISDSTAPGNPAYALGITSASYSSPLILRQRIYAPRIFSGGYVSGTFLAESTNGSAVTLTMSYIPSGTGTPQVICTGTTLTTGFTLIANATPVSITTGASGSAPSAYVDIAITIPVGAAIQITNIQLCGVSNNVETVAYLQNTPAEEINGLFHYFQPQLNFKPIPSMLVGWDFPMNPFQFINNNITTTPGYIGDQTIAASSTGTVAFSSDAVAGSAVFRTGTNSQAWYILQYLQGDQAFDAVTTILSSDIQAYVAGSGSCKVNVYMYYSNGGGVIPALPSTIGTINNSGVFSLTASGWSQILPITPDLAISLPSVSAVGANTQFIGYNAAQFYASSSTANFAMVVTFTAPTTSTTINVLSVSLNKGYIPTVPAPLTADEVLRQCQYYYETSDPDANGIYFPINSFYNGSTSTVSCATPFELNYQQKKRVSPAITITSLAGTAANVTNILNYQNATGVYTTTSPTDTPLSSFWANPVVGTTRLYYLPNTKNLIATATSQNSSTSYCNSANIYFNYILDSRLGVV